MKSAVGALMGVLLSALMIGIPVAGATTPGWTSTQAPGPVLDSTGYHLNSVDCWSAGNCVAVGYRSSDGTSGSFIDQETNGSWAYVSVSGTADLTSVSCPTAGACVAVGTSGPDSSSSKGVLEVQSAGTWTQIDATGPEGLYTSYTGSMTGISCPATGSCAAVGQAQSNSEVSTGFILTLQPGSNRTLAASWSAQKAPEAAGDAAYEDAGLAGVSCVSAGNCRAVGFAHDDQNYSDEIPLIDQEKSYVWSYGGSPFPSGITAGQLESVSCISGGQVCMAAGTYDNGVDPVIATIDTSTDGSEAASESLGAPFTSGELSASSCAPDGQCESVGETYAKSGVAYGYNGLVVSDKYGTSAGNSAGTATATDSPSDANTVEHNETLVSVSCVSGGVCVSVGSYLNNSGSQNQNEAAVIDTRTYDSSGASTGETDIEAPEPANNTVDDDQSLLSSVDCVDSEDCVAVGSYFNDTDESRGAIDTLGATVTPPAKAPTVGKVSPSRGKSAGGQTVTITGSHFGAGAKVKFGSAAGSHVHVVSSTKITVKTPGHNPGRVDVRVTTAGGSSPVTKTDRYTYVAAPAVAHVSPTSGTDHGGTTITITGKNLSGVTAVRFGSAKGTHVRVVSSTRILVTAPPQPPGTVDIEVTTAGGTSKKLHADRFTYI